MTFGDYDDPETWRERAKDARARAERLRDVTSRKLMFEIAETYDHLAERSAKLRGLLQLD